MDNSIPEEHKLEIMAVGENQHDALPSQEDGLEQGSVKEEEDDDILSRGGAVDRGGRDPEVTVEIGETYLCRRADNTWRKYVAILAICCTVRGVYPHV